MSWPIAYPPARRSDHVDVYQSATRGEVHVHDPYQWLEEDSAETKAWVEAQAKITNDFLAQNADRDRFKEDLRSTYNYPKFSLAVPRGRGDALRWYWTYNSGLEPHDIRYRSLSSTFPDFSHGQPADAEVFFDENLLSVDHSVSLSKAQMSVCGKYFAYGVSESVSPCC